MDSTKHARQEQQDSSHIEQTSEESIERAHHLISRESSESESGIHRLPFEILAYIFEFYVEFTNVWFYKPVKGPFLLGAVCRTWRHIAWMNPSLWTSLIFILDEKTTEVKVDLAIEWLGRSGNLPFSATLTGFNGREEEILRLIDAINESLSRCRHLALQFFTSLTFSRFSQIREASVLQSLIIDTSEQLDSQLDFGPLAAPHNLEISNIPWDFLVMNWTNLTDFRGTNLFVKDILEILTLAAQMTSCHVHDVRNPFVIPRHHDRKVVHSQLKYLNLRFQFSDHSLVDIAMITFFQNVTFPNLTTCKTGTYHEFPTTHFLDFVARSSCSITHLRLTEYYISSDDLIQIAQALPSITHLDLSYTYYNPDTQPPLTAFYEAFCRDSRYHTILPGDIVLFPMLQRLDIRTPCPFPWAWLPGFRSQYRQDGDTYTIAPGRPNLESFIIACRVYEADSTVVDDDLKCDEDGKPEYFPTGLIGSWETFSELMEMSKNVKLVLKVTQADSSDVDLFKLSYRKLEKTDGRTPKNIRESESAASWTTQF
ncbi:hypothetical protein CVT25_014338 [Psilocybe cyanescens]|uniref:Uncharacterized protein n=1 Tax=Psilocybe cyanescens TaxID=93625 RepID=A0A409WR07_PSICY|nr:hypothetical protein CVT25_014338 [Psilocybe cyanescens]